MQLNVSFCEIRIHCEFPQNYFNYNYNNNNKKKPSKTTTKKEYKQQKNTQQHETSVNTSAITVPTWTRTKITRNFETKHLFYIQMLLGP